MLKIIFICSFNLFKLLIAIINSIIIKNNLCIIGLNRSNIYLLYVLKLCFNILNIETLPNNFIIRKSFLCKFIYFRAF